MNIDVMFIIYSIFVFILTTCIGSFLNVVIYRLPLHMNLAKPASHCPNCNHEIKWYDNIPIISYIVLRGKCRYCKVRITPRYLIVELLTGIISTLIFIRFGISFNSLFGIILFLVLIPIAFIDIEHMEIPDIFIIILLVVGIIGIFFDDLNYGDGTFKVDWLSKLIGAGGVIVFAFIIILLERLFQKDLMGGGDLKLLFVSSLFLGWQLLILMIGIASILSCIVEITKEEIAIIKFKKLHKEDGLKYERGHRLFPFGPYLSISILICFVFGVNIIEWWLSFLSI